MPRADDYASPGLRYDRGADACSWRAMLDPFGETIDKPLPPLAGDQTAQPEENHPCSDISTVASSRGAVSIASCLVAIS